MGTSLAVQSELTCTSCQKVQEVDVWVLVDGAERPDLIKRIQTGAIRTVSCSCGKTNTLPDAPVLVYQSDADPRIVVATSSGTTEDPADQQAIVTLGRILKTALGPAWSDESAHEMKVTSTGLLPMVLSPDVDRRLRDVLSALVDRSWASRRDFVKDHRELLDERAITILDETIRAADRALDRDAERILTTIRAVLVRARDIGIEAAFDEQSPASRLVGAVPEIEIPGLREFLRRLAARGIDIERPDDIIAAVEADPNLQNEYSAIGRAAFKSLWNKIWALRAPPDLSRRADLLRQALEVIPPESPPELRAQVNFELGWTLLQPTGRRIEAVNEAVGAYEAALAYVAPEADEQRLATLKNLAAAYRFRDRSGDYELSYKALADAADLAARLRRPEELAGLVITRANLLRGRATTEGDAPLEEAIGLYRGLVFDPAVGPTPEVRGVALHCLGLAYAARVGGSRLRNLRRAARYCRDALVTRTRDADGLAWLGTTAMLARVEAASARCVPTHGARAAVAAFGAAIEFAEASGMSIAARDLAADLGALQFERQSWPEAAESYDRALAAAERGYAEALTDSSRETELAESAGLASPSSYAMAKAGRYEDAVKLLERARARGLGRYLGQDEVDLRLLGETHPDLAERYSIVGRRLVQLEAFERGPDELGASSPVASDSVADYARRAAAEHAAIVADIRAVPGHEGFLAMPDIAELVRALDSDESAVYLCTTESGAVALVVRGTPSGPVVEPVWSTLTVSALRSLLAGTADAPGYVAGQLGDAMVLRAVLPTVLHVLGEHLVAPLAEHLARHGIGRVVLIPGGLLALLPLHAAECGPNAQPFQDQVEVTYAPSLRAMVAARRKLSVLPDRKPYLAAVANPLPTPRPLMHADAEVQRIAQFFDAAQREVLHGRAADELSLLFAASRATHLHMACHGVFDPDVPLDSFLALSRDDRLTLREIVGRRHFNRVRLAVLSACQTAVTEFRRLPDEAIGLPAGFLRAGVPGVIGALWAIDDESTAVLMIEFYRLHLLGDGESGPLQPRTALRRAQQRVARMTRADITAVLEGTPVTGGGSLGSRVQPDGSRSSSADRPLAHPYYWAGFTFTGA